MSWSCPVCGGKAEAHGKGPSCNVLSELHPDVYASSGEYYADYDPETGLWCVFHTETNRAYASFSSEAEAKEEADKRNRPGDK